MSELRRPVLTAAMTVGAFALTWFALVAPDQRAELSLTSLARIPVEGLAVLGLLLVLPARASRVVAVAAGVLLGVLADLKLINAGFYENLDRPAHLVTDWPLVGSAMDYVTATHGRGLAVTSATVAAIALVVMVAVLALSARRIGQVVVRHRGGTARPLAVLGVAWVVCAVLGLQVAPGQPVAARSAAVMAHDQLAQIRTDLRDQPAYARHLGADRFGDTSAGQLLHGLRGKDVVLAFVESYGRSAVQDPAISPGVNAMLSSATRQLSGAGFSARSAFLTSPTAGGGSWLAHSTLLSGTWVNSPRRYTDLLDSNRTTLVGDFDRAGWRTVATMPATFKKWPEGAFYGYDRIDAGTVLGYRGPSFGWSRMPDQFTLEQVADRDLTPPHSTPVMVEVELTSSHTPWTPLPRQISWSDVGDGSVYGPMPAQGLSRSEVWADPHTVRTQYGLSVQYSVRTLISFLTRYGNDDTVLILLGDHQPAPIVTGVHASRDVPISIVARDPAVLDQIRSWGWQDGLRPGRDAPVWTMDSFRDRFLAAFSAGAR